MPESKPETMAMINVSIRLLSDVSFEVAVDDSDGDVYASTFGDTAAGALHAAGQYVEAVLFTAAGMDTSQILDLKAMKTMVDAGLPEDKAFDLLAMARKAGREMSEVETPDE